MRLLNSMSLRLCSGSFCVLLKAVDSHLSILSDLDDVAVGIAHVTSRFVTVVIERLGQKMRTLCRPLLVASPDVGHAQVEKAVERVQIARRLEKDLRLVRRRAAAKVQNDPGIGELDVNGMLADDFAAQNS